MTCTSAPLSIWIVATYSNPFFKAKWRVFVSDQTTKCYKTAICGTYKKSVYLPYVVSSHSRSSTFTSSSKIPWLWTSMSPKSNGNSSNWTLFWLALILVVVVVLKKSVYLPYVVCGGTPRCPCSCACKLLRPGISDLGHFKTLIFTLARKYVLNLIHKII